MFFIKDIQLVGEWFLVFIDEGLYWVEFFLQLVVIRKVFFDQCIWLIKKLFKDEQGCIWGSNNNNVFCIEGKVIKIYFFSVEYYSEDFMFFFSFVEDGWGYLFIVFKNGVFFWYDKENDVFFGLLYQFLVGVNVVL